MAATLTLKPKQNHGSENLQRALVTYTTYATGGNTFEAGEFGLGKINEAYVGGTAEGLAFDAVVSADGSSVTLKAYSSGGGVFEGTAIAATRTFTVYKNAAPAGADVYCKIGTAPTTYLAANHGGSSVYRVGTDALYIDDDATASADSAQVFADLTDLRLVADLSAIPSPPAKLFVTCYGGAVIEIENDSTAGLSALSYDPATGKFEAPFGPNSNIILRTSEVWNGLAARTPEGTIDPAPAQEVPNATDLSSFNNIILNVYGD